MKLGSRIDRLEQSRKQGTVLIWRGEGETPEQAEARHLAEHPQDCGRGILVLGWQDAEPAEVA